MAANVIMRDATTAGKLELSCEGPSKSPTCVRGPERKAPPIAPSPLHTPERLQPCLACGSHQSARRSSPEILWALSRWPWSSLHVDRQQPWLFPLNLLEKEAFPKDTTPMRVSVVERRGGPGTKEDLEKSMRDWAIVSTGLFHPMVDVWNAEG